MTRQRVRWFSHQPNVPGRGLVASYSPKFWLIVVGIGVAAGVGGALLMELLKFVEHTAWDYRLVAPVAGRARGQLLADRCAFLAAAMQGPLSSVVLVLEL